jgi:hypothetical protein
VFSFALLPCYKGAKQNTIRVIRGASVRLPHYMGHALVYPMENEKPLVHHTVEWFGCGYRNKNDKGVSERTKKHPRLKPKLIYACIVRIREGIRLG